MIAFHTSVAVGTPNRVADELRARQFVHRQAWILQVHSVAVTNLNPKCDALVQVYCAQVERLESEGAGTNALLTSPCLLMGNAKATLNPNWLHPAVKGDRTDAEALLKARVGVTCVLQSSYPLYHRLTLLPTELVFKVVAVHDEDLFAASSALVHYSLYPERGGGGV